MKYRDPYNKIVSEKTDLYAFAVTTLQLFIEDIIPNDADYNDIQKIYNKNKSKLPASFKDYYDGVFTGRERTYLTEYYENYLNNIYNKDIIPTEEEDNKSGRISVIILSFIMLVIAVIGYFVFKMSR